MAQMGMDGEETLIVSLLSLSDHYGSKAASYKAPVKRGVGLLEQRGRHRRVLEHGGEFRITN